MNKVILMGRLTKDPEVRYSQGTNPLTICRYSLAVNRSYKRDDEPDIDFINIVTFGNRAEFASKYFRKGMQVAVVGELRTGSYSDRDGNKRYTFEVAVTEQYFAEGRNQNRNNDPAEAKQSSDPDFVPAGTRTSPANSGSQSQKHATRPSRSSSSADNEFIPIPADYEGEDDLPF